MYVLTSAFLNDLLVTLYSLKFPGILLVISLFFFKVFPRKPSNKVYLVDFACYKPKKSQQIGIKESYYRVKHYATSFTPETLQMLLEGAITAGIGDETYAPEPLLKHPPDHSLDGGRSEAAAALFGAVDTLLIKTGITAEDIGVLVVNCSGFNPVPSLTSMIVNHYKLKDNIKSFNISGMGCSAGISAVGLAKELLQVHENTYAMVVSIEVLSPFAYRGNDRSKLSIQTVFRAGGAAILLSNRPSDCKSSKYRLIHTIRTNTSRSDQAYNCIYQEEDEQGLRGVTITKYLLVEARKTMTYHLSALGKLVLPTSEKLMFSLHYLMVKFRLKKPKPYIPNFGRVIDHFFPHLGGKSVIDELEKTLKLDVEAPRMTLYRFGNTSSSSVWYEFAYAEAKGRIKKGDRIWQVAFGSGFKCSSVIWEALKNVDKEKINPWYDEIDNYPIHLSFRPFPFTFVTPE